MMKLDGCVGGITYFGRHVVGRYRCFSGCNFDVCERCLRNEIPSLPQFAQEFPSWYFPPFPEPTFRMYIIDYPGPSFYFSCFGIVQTCKEFHMVGSQDSCVPSYEGATLVRSFQEPEERRKFIFDHAKTFTEMTRPALRLSIYTNDTILTPLLKALDSSSIQFLGIFRIYQKASDKNAYGCLECGNKHETNSCHGICPCWKAAFNLLRATRGFCIRPSSGMPGMLSSIPTELVLSILSFLDYGILTLQQLKMVFNYGSSRETLSLSLSKQEFLQKVGCFSSPKA